MLLKHVFHIFVFVFVRFIKGEHVLHGKALSKKKSSSSSPLYHDHHTEPTLETGRQTQNNTVKIETWFRPFSCFFFSFVFVVIFLPFFLYPPPTPPPSSPHTHPVDAWLLVCLCDWVGWWVFLSSFLCSFSLPLPLLFCLWRRAWPLDFLQITILISSMITHKHLST